MIFLPRNIQPILFIFILFLRIDKKSNNEAQFLDFFFFFFSFVYLGVLGAMRFVPLNHRFQIPSSNPNVRMFVAFGPTLPLVDY